MYLIIIFTILLSSVFVRAAYVILTESGYSLVEKLIGWLSVMTIVAVIGFWVSLVLN